VSESSDRPGRVIIVGSINVDLIMRVPHLPEPGETVLGGVLSRQHGGKGANQAVAAARAGAAVQLVGAVGAADGADSLVALSADGVGISHVAELDAPTGHAFVLVDDGGSGENQIAVASGANAALDAGQVTTALRAIGIAPRDVVVLSYELPARALRAAAAAARATGARLLVNPAPAAADRDDLLTGAICTPNAAELAALAAGRDAGTAAAAAVALARHIGGAVVVTLGKDGALLAGPDGTSEQFPAHPVEVCDTTGAGDTLTGVLAAALAGGADLRASVRRAIAAAALAVTRAGARTAMPTAAEIDRLLGRP
jgi:ribokinase